MRTGRGEQIWRPLANPRRLQVSGFQDTTPRGFGLMQRARAFADFQDLEARYHRRPGLWVEPMGDWGAGEVQLVEIPTRERDPRQHRRRLASRASALQRRRAAIRLRYRLHWDVGPRRCRASCCASPRRAAARVDAARRAALRARHLAAGRRASAPRCRNRQMTASAGQHRATPWCSRTPRRRAAPVLRTASPTAPGWASCAPRSAARAPGRSARPGPYRWTA